MWFLFWVVMCPAKTQGSIIIEGGEGNTQERLASITFHSFLLHRPIFHSSRSSQVHLQNKEFVSLGSYRASPRAYRSFVWIVSFSLRLSSAGWTLSLPQSFRRGNVAQRAVQCHGLGFLGYKLQMESTNQWAGHASESAFGANSCGRRQGVEAGLGRGKLGCNAVPIKVSAGSPGTAGAGIALQSCSKLAPRGQTFRH